jgi:hypothetical protein
VSKEPSSDPHRSGASADKVPADRGSGDTGRSDETAEVERQPFRPLKLPPSGFPYPFRRELAACIELLNFAKKKLNGTRLEFMDATSEVVAIHYFRAANTYEAILHLALDGFGPQAELLIRPLFELALTAAWASFNPTVTERRYDLHRRYAFSLWAAARENSGIYKRGNKREVLTPTEENEARRLFGRYAERSWTGKSLREMAKDISHRNEADDGGQVHWEAYMDVVHPFINWAMHSTGVGDRRAISHENGMAILTSGPSPADIRDVLSVAWWVYALALETLITHFELDFYHELRRIEFKAWASFKDPDLVRNLADTDPCPCQSGVAFGQCHGRLRKYGNSEPPLGSQL